MTEMEYEYLGCKVRIEQDTDPQSPAEWGDTNIFLVANHRQFYVAEPDEKRVPSDPNTLIKRYNKTHWIFPLEAYIHSGVCLAYGREGQFPDRRWDVSQLGFVFVSKKEWRLSKKAKEAGQCLIDSWNKYLSGEVYGYIIEDPDGDQIDSCWGIYDDDAFSYTKECAKNSIDHWCTKHAPVQQTELVLT